MKREGKTMHRMGRAFDGVSRSARLAAYSVDRFAIARRICSCKHFAGVHPLGACTVCGCLEFVWEVTS